MCSLADSALLCSIQTFCLSEYSFVHCRRVDEQPVHVSAMPFNRLCRENRNEHWRTERGRFLVNVGNFASNASDDAQLRHFTGELI